MSEFSVFHPQITISRWLARGPGITLTGNNFARDLPREDEFGVHFRDGVRNREFAERLPYKLFNIGGASNTHFSCKAPQCGSISTVFE